jgi:predicted TIM-barrel fold metal-dependent hydrolase
MVMQLQKLAPPGARVIPEPGPSLPAGTVVVSADDHFLEAEHLWEERLPARFRDRAPKLWRNEHGFHSEVGGIELGPIPPEDRPGMYDLEARIKDADAEGVAKQVLFPQRSLQLVRLEDRDLRHACLQVYNEWLAGHLSPYSERFHGVAVLNWWDVDAARDNIQAIKDLGFKFMMIPISPLDVQYNDPALEPLWSAIEESGIPLSIHVGESLRPESGPGGLGTTLLMTLSGHHFRRLFGLLAFSGVFERHPDLKVVFTEGGLGWIAPTLFEADKAYRDFETELMGAQGGNLSNQGGFSFSKSVETGIFQKPAQPPSYYWFQNCYATFQDDPVGIEQLDRIGWDRVMWASDYPHRESSLGYTRDVLRDIFNATTVEKAQAIVGGTATKLWGLS